MQLDRTHVVIRVRTLSEIGDLSLVMLRRYPQALLVGFFLGALPWMILNWALLAWIPMDQAIYDYDGDDSNEEITRYLTWMTLLVIAQTPIAGVATTFFLGQAVFEHRPTWRTVFREVKKQSVRWIWVLGIRRLAIPIMIVPLVCYGMPHDPFVDYGIAAMFFIAIILIRNGRPHAPEILLLEQCPLRAKDKTAITYRRRSRALHSPMSGELSGRFVAISFVMFFLFLSTLYTLVWIRGIATGMWNWDLFSYLVLYPISLWLVAGVSIVARLLCYLDTRIRLEGWEVELAIRAEAMRQFGEDQSSKRIQAPGATSVKNAKSEKASSMGVVAASILQPHATVESGS